MPVPWLSVLLTVVVTTWTSAAAQPDTKAPAVAVSPREDNAAADISPDLASLIAKHDIPAMSAIVLRGDSVIARGVAGVRKRGDSTPATLDDLWHLGSCTKSMTATMCAMLVERGSLRWDVTLAEALPDLAPRMHEQYRAATLAQLLSNRAGVPADLNAGGLWSKLWKFDGSPRDARAFLAEEVLSREPVYAPGAKNLYANAGFAIAAHIAEVAAGKPYEDLMRELVFAPLGMTSCGWGAPGTPDKSDHPWGHDRRGRPVNPLPNTPDGRGADNPVAISPAGRLHCTIGDWAKYVALHLRAGKSNPSRTCRLLTAETFDRLHTPPDDLSDYALGWARPERSWAGPEGDRFVLTHSGSNTMWFCVTWIAPKRDFAVLVCCNSGAENAPKACDAAAAMLIKRFNTD